MPTETPVTIPVALTVAMAGVADTHGFMVAAVVEPVSWVVDPTHRVNAPVIVGIG